MTTKPKTRKAPAADAILAAIAAHKAGEGKMIKESQHAEAPSFRPTMVREKTALSGS
jgi:hypothetical protein